MNLNKTYKKLKSKALILRQKTLLMFVKKQEAHLGGSFSMIEILLGLFHVIDVRRDKFILSKSHASFPLCILLKDYGFKPKIKTHLEIDKKWNSLYNWQSWSWFAYSNWDGICQ